MKQIENLDYFHQYWVGLMDGDGSIQINHWRKKGLQFRLAIELKLDPLNLRLLKKIEQSVGGSVREERKSGFLFWTENDRRRIEKMCAIFERFPPLTTRLACQLEFLLKCIRADQDSEKRAVLFLQSRKQCVAWYLENRGQKYSSRLEKRENLSMQALHQLPYFKGWLSGFIEAEGCFTMREASSRVVSFSISQKGDGYLLKEIALFFSIRNKIREISLNKTKNLPLCNKKPQEEPLFLLEVAKRETLREVVSHCTRYPLLGEKERSFIAFSHSIRKDGDIK